MRALMCLAAIMLLTSCGGGECERREVPCPPTDPLHSNFGTCYACD